MRIFRNKRRKTNGRRGQISDMQAAVLAVAAILVFSIFLYNSYTKLRDKMGVNSCKSSIQAHSIVATTTSGEMFTDIKCPTNEINIKKLKKTNEIIAEDMHRCWYIWDQGKGRYFKGDGAFCYVCSVYTFGDKGQTVTGLNDYLIRTDVPVKYAGETKGLKYIEYFQGYSTPNADRKIDVKSQIPVELDTIDTSQKYATIFVYASGKKAIAKMLEGGGRTAGITGLAMFGTVAGTGSAAAAGAASAATTTSYFMAYSTAAGTQMFWPISASAAAAYGGTGAAVGSMTVGSATAAGTVLGLTPVGWVVIGVVAVGAAGYGIYMLLDTPDPEWVSYIAFRPYTKDELNYLGCEKLAVNQMSNAAK